MMGLTLGHNKFLVQINYKSGTTVTLWYYSFSISNTEIEWHSVKGQAVMRMGFDDIESVFILKQKRGLLGNKK